MSRSVHKRWVVCLLDGFLFFGGNEDFRVAKNLLNKM